MYYELITNDHHKNNCALFKCWDDRKIFYKKASFSEKSNFIIENEKKGYSWFFSKIKKEDKTKLFKTYFYEINIPIFQGKNFSYNYRFPQNTEIVELIIEFYITNWLDKGKIVIHGDFALSNIIFNHNNELFIIDWEHYHISDSKYFGFDIIHLLFLTLYERINKISVTELDFLKHCYKLIIDGVSDNNQILEKPFVNCQKYLVEFSELFRLNIPIDRKFVLAKFPKNLLEKLDMLIT